MSNTPTKILCIAGARPNFPKIAPLLSEFDKIDSLEYFLLHTGQHYDEAMSKIFFEDLKIPKPNIDLGVGSGSHAMQTSDIIKKFEPILIEYQPQGILVVGDVNSTIACALVASKFRLESPFQWRSTLRYRPIVIHVEAGLRSFDDDMPEEINRKLTDCISDVLFVSDPQGMTNLKNEGVPEQNCFYVGNVMIDTLIRAKEKALTTNILHDIGAKNKKYILLTLHRPSNVDEPDVLHEILSALDEIAQDIPIVFPIHPRTRMNLTKVDINLSKDRWILLKPAGYLEFLNLEANAAMVITDSGGIQEETTVLGVPCMTIRENTERPVTVTEGTNILTSPSKADILSAFSKQRSLSGQKIPKYWDGKAAERIVNILDRLFHEKN